ncbi:MAG TPA: hypothetical protein P5256_03405 [Beijerinckiaceae bacterium]|nr:hypothetical protein [Rhizobiaceae bacterium]MCB9999490.1 hypothetical protein [Methylobacteriaceae bacterium]HRY02145.1 hypothetical protein [Beijerinckiaceae bacterium]
MKYKMFAYLLAGSCVVGFQAHAQQAPRHALPPATPLMAISGDGMFGLKLGQSIDLTDRKVLMTFPRNGYNTASNFDKKFVSIKFNGSDFGMTQGNRLNLKDFNPTSKQFASMRECFIDFIDISAPSGATPVATFRFECK